MSETESLSAAIEGLYRTFSNYPLRKHVEGCPCCVHETDKKALESKPLRKLLRSDLGRYASKAMTTWGDKGDFRHFLPRIFELTISRDGIGYDEEIVLGKLGRAGWTEWPKTEQAALRAFFKAGWRFLICQRTPNVKPDSWLCGLAIAGEDLRDYLSIWMEAKETNAYKHLDAFLKHHQPTYIKRHSLNNAFWPTAPHGMAHVCDWLADVETRRDLERIYFENIGSGLAPIISEVIMSLEQIVAD